MDLDGDAPSDDESKTTKPKNNYDSSKYAERNKRKRKGVQQDKNNLGKKFKAKRAVCVYVCVCVCVCVCL